MTPIDRNDPAYVGLRHKHPAVRAWWRRRLNAQPQPPCIYPEPEPDRYDDVLRDALEGRDAIDVTDLALDQFRWGLAEGAGLQHEGRYIEAGEAEVWIEDGTGSRIDDARIVCRVKPHVSAMREVLEPYAPADHVTREQAMEAARVARVVREKREKAREIRERAMDNARRERGQCKEARNA